MNMTISDDTKPWEIKIYIIKFWGVMATLDKGVREGGSKKLTFKLINVNFTRKK